MKRVKVACLYQTISFILDLKVSIEIAIDKVKYEVATYKAKVGSNLQILREIQYEDGSFELEVRKSVSGYPLDNYFN